VRLYVGEHGTVTILLPTSSTSRSVVCGPPSPCPPAPFGSPSTTLRQAQGTTARVQLGGRTPQGPNGSEGWAALWACRSPVDPNTPRADRLCEPAETLFPLLARRGGGRHHASSAVRMMSEAARDSPMWPVLSVRP